MKSSKEIRDRIIQAGYVAVEQLIRVAEEDILKSNSSDDDSDLAADKLKNAAASKKLAIFDAFEILSRIELEKESIEMGAQDAETSRQGFAERRSK